MNSSGLIVTIKGQTTLPWWSYIIALILGAFITVGYQIDLPIFFFSPLTRVIFSHQPFSTILFARMGNGIATNQLMKMVAGAINPGKPVANLYVCTTFFLFF